MANLSREICFKLVCLLKAIQNYPLFNNPFKNMILSLESIHFVKHVRADLFLHQAKNSRF